MGSTTSSRGQPGQCGLLIVSVCGAQRSPADNASTNIFRSPRVVVSAGKTELLVTTTKADSSNPVWNETVKTYVDNVVDDLLFILYENTSSSPGAVTSKTAYGQGPTEFGRMTITVQLLGSGLIVDGPFHLITSAGADTGSLLTVRAKYQSGESLQNSVEVPDCYFPMTTGNMVTLYQDAHSGTSGQHSTSSSGSAWDDLNAALENARYFIYIIGWSFLTEVHLLRNGKVSTIGELLKRKHQVDGVRVLVLLSGHMEGSAHKYNTAAQKYFDGTGVVCRLEKGSEVFYTQHQKCVVLDADVASIGSRGSNTGAPPRRTVAFLGGLDMTLGRWDNQDHSLFATLNTLHSGDFLQDCAADVRPECGPRQPWHDTYSRVEGPATLHLLQNFEERWRHLGSEAASKLADIPGTTIDLKSQPAGNADEKWNTQVFRSISAQSADFNKNMAINLVLKNERNHVDDSIQQAYIHNIRRAKSFVFIENQYFLGSSNKWEHNNPDIVQANNKVPLTIVDAICKSIDAGKRLAVYVLLTMFPDGSPDDVVANDARQAILRWQYRTIEMMYQKIAEKLKKNGQSKAGTPTDYLNFYCLGKRENDLPTNLADPKSSTEKLLRKTRRFLIYVHSKTMIVDDEYVIIGSANLNERSLNGTRDTEIAIGAMQPAHTFKESFARGRVYDFRIALWSEHTGGTYGEFDNPGSLECVTKVNSIAEANLQKYVDNDSKQVSGNLLKYPFKVSKVGSLKPILPRNRFPDTEIVVFGRDLTGLPPVLTT